MPKKPWTSARIREQFLNYFVQHGHKLVPSSSLVPHNDPTVFLTTAGMQQMVPYFLGLETPPAIRMTSSQKCFRTVDIDEVGDSRHNTFFEMLGNFSVGDYFKEGAITYAWDLLTKVYGLDPERLYPSVYPTDDEAIRLWQEIAGLPRERITPLQDNWWDRGPTVPGPAGPDSEIYYDRGEKYGCGKETCGPGCDDCDRYLEIWNLVFMQYNQDGKGGREPLANPNIDTGMGLERLTLVLQNKDTVFETDLFMPIITRFAQIAGVKYGTNPQSDTSLRVIADHGRSLVFLAGDGVLPSNEGRGYIFRRVLRRAVRHGKLLGLDRPFLGEAADTVIELMAGQYPELRDHRDRIVDVLTLEERKFGQTLAAGLHLLGEKLSELERTGQTELAGEDAFTLYDTHGFPLELTLEVAQEHGMTVDQAGFKVAAERQRQLSKQKTTLAAEREDELWKHMKATLPPTTFTGYPTTQGQSHVVGLVAEGQPQEMLAAPQTALAPLEPTEAPLMAVVLAETPFYAESGGQVGDHGVLTSPTGTFQVLDTQRPVSGLIVHLGQMTEGYLKVGSALTAQVDETRRDATRRNHSATHLLHRALKDMLGESVVQQGSLVEPNRLRFDFNHPRPLTDDQLAGIDAAVNGWIRSNLSVATKLTPLDEARQSGAMALFGEKYPDPVRVVTMGRSKELCGGTHVAATGQIGVYVTTQEVSTAAGIRRIEALTGQAAETYLMSRKRLVDDLASHLQTHPDQVATRVAQLEADLTAARQELAAMRRVGMSAEADRLAQTATRVRGHSVVAASVTELDVEALREMSDRIRERLGQAVVLLASATAEGGTTFIVTVSPDLTRHGLHAGKLAQRVAERLGGKGGGRPESAQGGSRSAADLAAVVADFPQVIDALLG
ncbi:MAG: alanine--tRNA ligase [Ktedonobacterales bacterium]|nr:alanine--tRNA ligase [Ktedonobacterales bacterium]